MPRPWTFSGVPLSVLILEVAMVVQALLATGSFLSLPIALATRGASALISLRERRFAGAARFLDPGADTFARDGALALPRLAAPNDRA